LESLFEIDQFVILIMMAGLLNVCSKTPLEHFEQTNVSRALEAFPKTHGELRITDLGPSDGKEVVGVSSRKAAQLALTKWVRVIWRKEQSAHDVLSAPGDLGTPVWPEVGMRDILMVAFGETFTIWDAGHPVVKRLLGQA